LHGEDPNSRMYSQVIKDRGFNKIQNCLESIRLTLPHPLTPSPKAGEGEQDSSYSLLPERERAKSVSYLIHDPKYTHSSD
jgi:hypothetical protein